MTSLSLAMLNMQEDNKKEIEFQFTEEETNDDSFVNRDVEKAQKEDFGKEQKQFVSTFPQKKKKSLNSIIIFWIRMTMGLGIFTVPYYSSQLGVTMAAATIILGGILTLIKFKFIFEASSAYNISSYSNLVKKLLPKPISMVFQFFYLAELLNIFSLYCICGWNLFKYILFIFHYYKDEWIPNKQNLIWDEYNGEVFLLRVAYFGGLFILLFPLLFKKNVSQLKVVTYCFLFTLIALILILMIEAPFFRINRQQKDNFSVNYGAKNITIDAIVIFFSITMSYYVQPFALDLKKELFYPTLPRIKKVFKTSVLVEIIVYLIFGLVGYICFGDGQTPELLMLRPAYEGKSQITETIVQVVIVFFFLFNNLGLSVFNPCIRNYLMELLNKDNNLVFISSSLFPIIFGCLLGIFMPSITFIFWVNGLIICNFNGYIIPCLLKLKILGNKRTLAKIGVYGLVTFYALCGALGTYYQIFIKPQQGQDIQDDLPMEVIQLKFLRQLYSNKMSPSSCSSFSWKVLEKFLVFQKGSSPS